MKITKYLFFLFFIILLPSATLAAEVDISWNDNTESNLAGYRVYWREGSDGYYNDPIEVDAATITCSIAGFPPGSFQMFDVTAFNTDQEESVHSEPVDVFIPFSIEYKGEDEYYAISLLGSTFYDSSNNFLEVDVAVGNSSPTSTLIPNYSTGTSTNPVVETGDLYKVTLPPLVKGDIVILNGDFYHYRPGFGEDVVANIPNRIRDMSIVTGNPFCSNQFDALVSYGQTFKSIPIIVNNDCQSPTFYSWFDLQSGVTGISNPYFEVLHDQLVVTKLFINRLVKTATGIGAEIMWDVIPGVTTYRCWAGYLSDAYIYDVSKNTVLDADVEGNSIIIDITSAQPFYFFVVPDGGTYAQMIPIMPFNVTGHGHEGLLHHQITIDTNDTAWITKNLGKIPVTNTGNGWMDTNGFADNTVAGKVTTIHLVKVKARLGRVMPLGIQ